MISITTINYDYAGHIFLTPKPDTHRITYQRRVSKSATLDGFSSISDFGYTASDNTLTIKVPNSTPDMVERLIYLLKNYPLLRMATEDGVFLGSLRDIRVNLTPLEFIFDIKQQVI